MTVIKFSRGGLGIIGKSLFLIKGAYILLISEHIYIHIYFYDNDIFFQSFKGR